MNHKKILFILMFVLAAAAHAGVVYSNITDPLPPNVPSLGYQANSTTEFGGQITLAHGGPLNWVKVVMSSWALESTYQQVGTSTGFDVPLQLTVYGVGPGNTLGDVLAESSPIAHILWRPEASPGCGSAYSAQSGCWNGLAQVVTFTFAGEAVPDQVILGLAFNTRTHGYNPAGVAGVYDSLNFGLATAVPSVGSDPTPGTVFWNTSGAVDGFQAASDWDPYSPMMAVNVSASVPEPMTFTLIVPSIAILGLALRRRKKHS